MLNFLINFFIKKQRKLVNNICGYLNNYVISVKIEYKFNIQPGTLIIQSKLMYIDQIVLEGFKTYMNRTVIAQFDPQFNAITGLNGSGKSNILDAIQFLLGSTSKEMLRLKSGLTQLIYKQGFAGIEKASVTISFKCPDKNMRPSGYENCQELVITRQISKDKVTRFFVNGVTSNLSKVKSLFRSVHLNIENPHFLVKQGQITKVINLKPLQLLGMIEQTAGTAYYNRTKQQSEKIMAKKQVKLNSINEILKESIQPQMEKLNADRKRYNDFKDKESYMRKLISMIKTYEYVTKTTQWKKTQSQIVHLKQSQNAKKTIVQENSGKIQEIQAQIKILKSKTMSSIQAEYNQKKNVISQTINESKQIKHRVEKLNNETLNLKKQINENEDEIQRKKKDVEWQSKSMLQAQKQKDEIQTLLSEIGNSQGSAKDAKVFLQKQMKQLANQVKGIDAEIATMNSKKQLLKIQAENDQRQKQEFQMNKESLGTTLKTLQEQIKMLQNLQPPRHIDDPQLTTGTQLKRLENEKKKLLQNYQIRLLFNDPHPGFDRRKVKGKLFMLFKVKQKIHERALQIGAGSKLINVVVQNQQVAKTMIQKQCFGKNVTVIPNNKIRYRELKDQVINEAHRIASELGALAEPAYSLVDYDIELQNSIKFAFSDFIVCSSAEAAKRISFNQNRMLTCKCVTYEGDVFEPGTLTGGYSNVQSMLINQYNQLRSIQDKMIEQGNRISKQKKIYSQYLQRVNEYKSNKREQQLKQQKRDKIKTRLANIAMNVKQKNYSQEIQDIDGRIKELLKELQGVKKKLQDLQSNVGSASSKNLQQQKKQLLNQKKNLQKKMASIRKAISIAQVQIEQLLISVKHASDTDDQIQKDLFNLSRRQKKLDSDLSNLQIQFEQIEQRKNKYEKEQALNESQIHLLSIQLNQLKNQNEKIDLDLQNIDTAIEGSVKNIQLLKEGVKQVMLQCPWLQPDKHYQIQPNFHYQTAHAEYSKLGQEVDRLRKTAKMNIDQNSYTKLQDQYKDLQEKRSILEKDKVTLLGNIHDLDQKRTVTLQHCFNVVKENLKRIFTDLLPGAEAVLTLINPNDVTEGAELHVHFNNVKKQLSELSGGQRSLLALSFILSLLLYKPAPFYILDQIDSALDLSHTQNIGYMISQRFPQSQFILISLKQGMFQNANVLYKVSFVDGQSKVQRQIIKKKS